MNDPAVVLVAEDDPGHAILIEESLRQAGIGNDTVRFSDGQECVA